MDKPELADRETIIRLTMAMGDSAVAAVVVQFLDRIEALEKQVKELGRKSGGYLTSYDLSNGGR